MPSLQRLLTSLVCELLRRNGKNSEAILIAFPIASSNHAWMKVLSWCLNLFGLFVGMIAALLMYYFPPRVQAYTETGAMAFTWSTDPSEEGKRKAKHQMFLANTAPIVLRLSFVLQFFAAWLEILN